MDLGEILTFKKMIAPIFIQILFWLGIVGVIIAGVGAITQGQIGAGLGFLILGPLGVRIYAEIFMVMFKINEGVQEMAKNSRQNTFE